MLKYPDTIRLGGTEFVVMLSEEPLMHPKKEGVRLNGATLMDHRMILLYDNKKAPLQTEECFVHETIEGIIDTFDLRYEDPTTGKMYVMPHSAIKTLGVALHQAYAEAGIDFSQSALNTGKMNTTIH